MPINTNYHAITPPTQKFMSPAYETPSPMKSPAPFDSEKFKDLNLTVNRQKFLADLLGVGDMSASKINRTSAEVL